MSALILASTSRYRAELLARLHIPFDTAAPETDETPRQGEAADELARRLARGKAQAVAARQPGCWVLGSDQVASLDGALLGKPGSADRAAEQLQRCSGKTLRFATAAALINAERCLEALDLTVVHFRTLEAGEIERYVAAEQPYDCAGSFRCEGLGIALFQRIETQDPTALIGLPLIAVSRLLRAAGFPLP